MCSGNIHNYGDTSCPCGEESSCQPPSKNCETTTQWVMTCPSGGNTGGDDGNDNSDGNTTGGGNGGNNNDSGIPVIPVEETPMDRILECINEMSVTGPNVTMPQSLADSLSMSPQCAGSLDNFLEGEGCDFENKSFALEAARACLNGDVVDYDERIIIELTGRDKCIYNELKTLDIFENTVTNFTTGPYNLTFTYAGSCNGGAGEEACTDPADLENGNITIKILSS